MIQNDLLTNTKEIEADTLITFKIIAEDAYKFLEKNIRNYDWITRLLNKYENTKKLTQLDIFDFMNSLKRSMEVSTLRELIDIKLEVPELLMINFEIFYRLFDFLDTRLK